MNVSRALKKVNSKHIHLTDLEEKSALFDKAAAKYSAKVSS
jgi:coatomer subunit epsilon